MDFKQIEELKKEDVLELLTERVLARGVITEEDIDEEILGIELEEYKDFLKRQELRAQVLLLVDNNCATVAAFPESASNYKLWLNANVTENPDIEEAIANLSLIQSAEIDMIEEKLVQTQINELENLGKLSASICQRVINTISGYFIVTDLTTEQIDTLKEQFADINAYLFGNQQWAAKALISNLVVDEEIITTDIKTKLLTILTNTGLPGL